MRTTIRLDEALLRQAKQEAACRKQTLTALIESGLRLVLAQSKQAVNRPRVDLPVSRARGGVRPGVNLDSTAELLEVMENRR